MKAFRRRHQQQHQQRCEKNSQQARDAGRDDRGGDVAARDAGEGDGGLHRRWHEGAEENAQVEFVSDDRLQRHHRHADQREDHEGKHHDQQVQPPVHQAFQSLLRRQARAVEEKQERDGDLRDDVGDIRRLAAHGHNDRRDDRDDDQDDEEVRPVVNDAVP